MRRLIINPQFGQLQYGPYNPTYTNKIQVVSVPPPHMGQPAPTSMSDEAQNAYIPSHWYNPYYLFICPPISSPMPHMEVNLVQPTFTQHN